MMHLLLSTRMHNALWDMMLQSSKFKMKFLFAFWTWRNLRAHKTCRHLAALSYYLDNLILALYWWKVCFNIKQHLFIIYSMLLYGSLGLNASFQRWQKIKVAYWNKKVKLDLIKTRIKAGQLHFIVSMPKSANIQDCRSYILLARFIFTENI